jgi:hypothetical protein
MKRSRGKSHAGVLGEGRAGGIERDEDPSIKYLAKKFFLATADRITGSS